MRVLCPAHIPVKVVKPPHSIVCHKAFFPMKFVYVILFIVIQIGFCSVEVYVFIECCQFILRYLCDVDSNPLIVQVLREIIRHSFHVA